MRKVTKLPKSAKDYPEASNRYDMCKCPGLFLLLDISFNAVSNYPTLINFN